MTLRALGVVALMVALTACAARGRGVAGGPPERTAAEPEPEVSTAQSAPEPVNGTEYITFDGPDAPASMPDVVVAPPRREPFPSIIDASMLGGPRR